VLVFHCEKGGHDWALKVYQEKLKNSILNDLDSIEREVKVL
jgi:hypothetical protein